MITDVAVKEYCKSMKLAKPRYVWGADGQVITEDLIEFLSAQFGDSHYKKEEILLYQGHLAFDCSGFLTPISGKNWTAQRYFEACTKTGLSKAMDLKQVQLVFRMKNGNIVHTGIYTGNTYTYEMYEFCDVKKIDKEYWTHFGIPTWIHYTAPGESGTFKLEFQVPGYYTASDAISCVNARTTLAPGVYFIFRKVTGALNLTKQKGTPGSWIKWEDKEK